MEKVTSDGVFRIMSRQEVRQVDAWAIQEIGVPGVVLMENAGRHAADAVEALLGGSVRARGVVRGRQVHTRKSPRVLRMGF